MNENTAMARPSKLTPEVATAIADRIRGGATLAQAAEAEDVADRTAREWLQAGTADSTGPCGDFARLVTRATHARAAEELGVGALPTPAPVSAETLPPIPGLELVNLEALRAPAEAWLGAIAHATDYRAQKDRARVKLNELRAELDGMDQRIRIAETAAQRARRDQLLNDADQTVLPEVAEVEALRRHKAQLLADIEALSSLLREVGQDGANHNAETAAERAFAAALHQQMWPQLKAALGPVVEVFELAMLFKAAGHPLIPLHPTDAGWHIEPCPTITSGNGPGWLKSIAERAAS